MIELLIIEGLLIGMILVPLIINMGRGKAHFQFKRPVLQSRPFMIYCSVIQLFLWVMLIALDRQRGLFLWVLACVFFLMVISTIVDAQKVQEGVFEKGLIIEGFLYEWGQIISYHVAYMDGEEMVIRFCLVSRRKQGQAKDLKIDPLLGEALIRALDDMK